MATSQTRVYFQRFAGNLKNVKTYNYQKNPFYFIKIFKLFFKLFQAKKPKFKKSNALEPNGSP